MADQSKFDRTANPSVVVDAIRADRYPAVDRDLMLTFLQLHASAERPENLSRLVDEALAGAVRGQG